MPRVTTHKCWCCGKGIGAKSLVLDTVGGHRRPFIREHWRKWKEELAKPSLLSASQERAESRQPADIGRAQEESAQGSAASVLPPAPPEADVKSQDTRGKKIQQKNPVFQARDRSDGLADVYGSNGRRVNKKPMPKPEAAQQARDLSRGKK